MSGVLELQACDFTRVFILDGILGEVDGLAVKLVPMLEPLMGVIGLVVTKNNCAIKQMRL